MTAAKIVQWFSPFGLALTVLGNAEGILKLSDWANLLVRKWNDIILFCWSHVFQWFSLAISQIAAQLLTVFVIVFVPACFTWLRYGNWTVYDDAERTTLSAGSKAQGYFVPAILLIAIPAYTFLIAPDALNWLRGPDCPWEWGRVCINPDFALFGNRWLGALAIFLVYFGAIFILIAIGHPRRVFRHLMYGLIIAGAILALSELSKLGISVPDAKNI